MSITIGAALKNVTASLLTDKNVRKGIGMTILVLFISLALPLVAILAVLSGDLTLNTEELLGQIESALSAGEFEMLTGVENTMTDIEVAMGSTGLSERITEAQALYIMALFDQAEQEDFVTRLVSCFWDTQTNDQLIAAVNLEFGTNITAEEFSFVYEYLYPAN